MSSDASPPRCTIIGIGNVLMGDEGIGVHVARRLQSMELPPDVVCIDGGTGGFALLDAFQRTGRVVLIDATADGAPPGTVRRLRPRFSADYPRTLAAHDIGLKDLLDAATLTGGAQDVTLFAVSIDAPGGLRTELSPDLEALAPRLAAMVAEEAGR